MLHMHNHAVTNLPCSQCTIRQSPTSHALNVQSCSHHPHMLPVHNHAVTNLPCSQCTIMQSPTSHAPNAQSGSHQPPMLSMYNHAVTTLTCSQCTIMQSPTSHAPNVQSCSHQPPMLHMMPRSQAPPSFPSLLARKSGFSVLQAMESWAGPENKATPHAPSGSHQPLFLLDVNQELQELQESRKTGICLNDCYSILYMQKVQSSLCVWVCVCG